MNEAYDVAVVGAGPVGSVAALAYAKRGASVLLLEANPRAARRFAGEWLHPPAVNVLQHLGIGPHDVSPHHAQGQGFVVFPDNGSEPIQLPYSNGGLALCCEHLTLVSALRSAAADNQLVRYAPGCRVSELGDGRIEFHDEHAGMARNVTVEQIVGADGRSSVVRKHLGLSDNSKVISYMAGVRLLDIELPFEGSGHVYPGQPGPMLMYRIGPGEVRLTIDVPRQRAAIRHDVEALYDAIQSTISKPIADAFRVAVERDGLTWMGTRFRPRSEYGSGDVALVGDAVGYFHPLSASGMTLGFRDALSLAESQSLAEYARGREADSYAPELLSNALYQVFTGQGQDAADMRNCIFQTWRKSASARTQLMNFLSANDTNLSRFSTAFIEIGLHAALRSVAEAVSDNQWISIPGRLSGVATWAGWPAAGLMPRSLRRRVRSRSMPASPIRGAAPSAG